MKENYADVLESYLIPAQEGFAGKTIKILGIAALSLIAMPFVLIGGICWVSGIELKKAHKRFKKELQEQAKNNGGNLASYGNKSNAVFNSYVKDIVKIEEPVQLQKLIPVFKKAEEFSKEVDVIRKEYAQVLKNDPFDQNGCREILKKFTQLHSKIEKYYNSNKSLYQIDNSSERQVTDIGSSVLVKLKNIEESNSNILYFNENSIPENWVYKYIWYDDKFWDARDDDRYDNALDMQIYDIFGAIYYLLLDLTNWEDFVESCKFALNPKLKSE